MDRFVPARGYDVDAQPRLLGAPLSPVPSTGLSRASGSSFSLWADVAAAHRPRSDAAPRVDASRTVHGAMLQMELGIGHDDARMPDVRSAFERDAHAAARAPPSSLASPDLLLQRDFGGGGSGEGGPPTTPHSPASWGPRVLSFNAEGPRSPLRRPPAGMAPGALVAALSPGSSALLQSASFRPRQRISRAPYRVLDAPGLADDFYLNLLDWSAQNVVVVGLSADVYLWNSFSGSVTKLVALVDDKSASVSWSARGGHVAVGTDKGLVQIWDATESKLLRTLKGHAARVGSMAWAGPLLATSGKDKTVLVRDMRSPADSCASLRGHSQEVCGLRWSLDWTMLASGGNDNKLFVWSAAKMGERAPPPSTHAPATTTSALLYRFTSHVAAVKALAWSPHQPGLLASGGGTQDKSIKFWNTNTGELLSSIDAGSQLCQLAWSPSRPQLVSCHGYNTNAIVVWDWPSMRAVGSMTGHTSRVLYMAMAPDGAHICTGAGDETLRFWEIQTTVSDGERSDERERDPLLALAKSPGRRELGGVPGVSAVGLFGDRGAGMVVR